jgi:transposase
MQTQSVVFFGADIGKDLVVIARHGEEAAPVSLPNTRTALNKWLRTVPDGSILAMEATGGYHRLLADLAHAKHLTVYVLNPRWLHHYARSRGQRGKTDRLDSRMIARFISQEHDKHGKLHPYQPAEPHIEQVRSLQTMRDRVVSLRTALKLSSQRRKSVDPAVKRATARALKALDDLAHTLVLKMHEQFKDHPNLQEDFELLTSLSGFGELNGLAFTALFARVPLKNSDAVVAFLGMDPRPKDSGKFIGQRKLSKQGDKYLRCLLYNAASAASRTKVFKPYYQALKAKGWASTAALNILARKLLRIAFAMWKSRVPFDPQRFIGLDEIAGQKP